MTVDKVVFKPGMKASDLPVGTNFMDTHKKLRRVIWNGSTQSKQTVRVFSRLSYKLSPMPIDQIYVQYVYTDQDELRYN